MRASNPVSSLTSRTADCSWVSPSSMCPLGSDQSVCRARCTTATSYPAEVRRYTTPPLETSLVAFRARALIYRVERQLSSNQPPSFRLSNDRRRQFIHAAEHVVGSRFSYIVAARRAPGNACRLGAGGSTGLYVHYRIAQVEGLVRLDAQALAGCEQRVGVGLVAGGILVGNQRTEKRQQV